MYFRRGVHTWARYSAQAAEATEAARIKWRRCKKAFGVYAGQLHRRPIVVQMMTSGTIFALGDITAQQYEAYLEKKEHAASAHKESIFGVGNTAHTVHCQHDADGHQQDSSGALFNLNWKRLLACSTFGLIVMGPVGHMWYLHLDRIVGARYPLKTRMAKHIATKVVLDTIIFNPLFLVIFFTSVSAVEGFSLHYMQQKLRRDFVPSYAVDTCMWPAIQCVNFALVPVSYQLLVVNLFCFFDDVFISYVQHRGMPAIFERIEVWWYNKLGKDTMDEIERDMQEEEHRIHPHLAHASPTSASTQPQLAPA